MLKKIRPLAFTSLSKKAKAKVKATNGVLHHHNCHNFEHSCRQSLLVREGGEGGILSPVKTPTGTFAVYVGEERERFVVPTSFLSHPLFKILLEKAYDEFGFEQQSGLVVPCSVSTFQEVVNAVESNNGGFDMRKIFQEFV